MKQKIQIAIADDEQLFRRGLTFLLEKEEQFQILFEAENGQELIDKLNPDELPDVILMDLKMPILNGVEATKQIHKKYPDVKIVALTSYHGKSFITNMIDVGASSYLLKSTSPKIMIHTINEVYEKGFYYDEKVMKTIHENLLSSSGGKRIKSDLDKRLLSKREIEVLELICEQYTTSEIAEKLFISPRTVDGHRNNLLLKTESKNVAGLVIYGIQKKLIELSPKF